MFSKKNPQKLSAKVLRSSRYGVPLVTVQDPQNVVAEQFRVLRANIDFAAASLKISKLSSSLVQKCPMASQLPLKI